jgi:glycosyltransferase involved in cell wall biosynthesis
MVIFLGKGAMISIIIPTFNEEVFLPRLLKSIEEQTYRDFEVIIADNHSSDRTREIATLFSARMVDGGIPSVARNRGADAAAGEYMLFLDADSVIPRNFLIRLNKRFEKDFIDICIPSLKPIDSSKPIYKTMFKLANSYFKLMEGVKPQGGGACIFVTKRLHRRIGGFDETRRRSEDLDYINRAAQVGRFRCYLDLYVYFSVRRFEVEGISACAQKYLRSGFIFFFSGKQDWRSQYEYGKFYRAVVQASQIEKQDANDHITYRLLKRFNDLIEQLKKQLKELYTESSFFRSLRKAS